MVVVCGIIAFKNNIIYACSFKKNKDNLIKDNKLERAKSNILKYLKDILYTTLSAQIVIFPIIMYNFNFISLNFLISNILANSIVGIVTVGGFLLCIIILLSKIISEIFAIPYRLFLNLLIQVSRICSNLPLSQIYIATPSIFMIIIYYIVVLLLNYTYSLYVNKNKRITQIKYIKYIKGILLKLKINTYNIVIIITITIIVFTFINLIPKKLKIYFIDVGQGDSTLIITPTNKKVLVDGGGSKDLSDFDIGEDVLLPYLLDRKVTCLDYILISHFDADHCNGLIAILNNIKVKNLIISKQAYICQEYINIINIAKKENIKIKEVKQGERINIDKYVYLDILYPGEKLHFNDLNNNSIVFKLVYRSFTMLFTGDIEEKAEYKILNNENVSNNLKSIILKVAHHGSNTSSTQKFIEKVNPRICLIGVGKDNNFGHPNSDILNRLNELRYKSSQDR